MSMVVKQTQAKNGVITLEWDTREQQKYSAVRGGLAWPLMEQNLPGYFCIVGEEYLEPLRGPDREFDERRGRLHLLAEYEAPTVLTGLEVLFGKAVEDAAIYLCESFYAVTEECRGEDFSGYARAFHEFASKKKADVRLSMAPWADKADLGLYHIQKWMKEGLLEFPEESIARNQLRMIEAEKIAQVPLTYNAVNGLRFAVCGFEQHRPEGGRRTVTDILDATDFSSRWQ
jgi:hypothetical protein